MSPVRLKKTDINFLVIPPGVGNKEKVQKIEIARIQPSEDFLGEKVVKYFIANPSDIFSRRRERIRIARSPDPRFEFYVIDGNNRLYSYFALGYKYVNIVPDYNYYLYLAPDDDPDPELEEAIAAIDTYDMGVTKWSDLGSRIIPLSSIMKLCDGV